MSKSKTDEYLDDRIRAAGGRIRNTETVLSHSIRQLESKVSTLVDSVNRIGTSVDLAHERMNMFNHESFSRNGRQVERIDYGMVDGCMDFNPAFHALEAETAAAQQQTSSSPSPEEIAAARLLSATPFTDLELLIQSETDYRNGANVKQYIGKPLECVRVSRDYNFNGHLLPEGSYFLHLEQADGSKVWCHMDGEWFERTYSLVDDNRPSYQVLTLRNEELLKINAELRGANTTLRRMVSQEMPFIDRPIGGPG